MFEQKLKIFKFIKLYYIVTDNTQIPSIVHTLHTINNNDFMNMPYKMNQVFYV